MRCPISYTQVGSRSFRVDKQVEMLGKSQVFVVAVGFLTDLASVPKLLWWLYPPFGRYTKAAVVHDMLTRVSRHAWGKKVSTFVDQDGVEWFPLEGFNYPMSYIIDPNDVDGIFKRCIRQCGSGPHVYWPMWAAVRWASIFTGRKGAMSFRVWAELVSVSVAFLLPFILLILVPILFL